MPPRNDMRFLERLPLAADRPWLGYAGSLAMIVIAWLTRAAADGILPVGGFPYVTFFPAVMLSAFLFGTRPGSFAAVVCGLIAWYFFIPPVRTFHFDFGTFVALIFYLSVVATFIALNRWLQQAIHALSTERERSGELAQSRELMFRELQHRISNKLQIIAALLSLQRRQVADPAASRALEDAARRVALIGRISRALHDPTHGGLGLGPFLEQISRDILDAAGRSDIAITIDCDRAADLSDDAAVPFALIFAEIVSNAVEHGFAGRDHGRIDVTARLQPGNRLRLDVSNDGAAVPAGFDIATSESLGLRIATTMAQSLHGSFTLEPAGEGQGAKAVVDIAL